MVISAACFQSLPCLASCRGYDHPLQTDLICPSGVGSSGVSTVVTRRLVFCVLTFNGVGSG